MKVWAFLENIIYIVAAVILAGLIQAFVIRPFIVSGSSMDPVIKHGQYMIIDQISYRINPPSRGDVIVFKAPPEPKKYYIKRIIGLPGETVQIQGSIITIINDDHPEGFVLEETFITHMKKDSLTKKVPTGQYFVLGDNRDGSFDSRGWGTLPEKNIRGRALLRLLPITTISYLPGKITYGEK